MVDEGVVEGELQSDPDTANDEWVTTNKRAPVFFKDGVNEPEIPFSAFVARRVSERVAVLQFLICCEVFCAHG